MARRTGNLAKVTLSLPRELVEFADAKATELETSRSQIVTQALAALRAEEEDELAREGYALYAADNAEFAAASRSAASETFGRAS
jgi:metal-responsive CopG/Arc/MetJ family transcriptional regulator